MSNEPIQDPTPLQMATLDELIDEMTSRCEAIVIFGTVKQTARGGHVISAMGGDPFTCMGIADAVTAMARGNLTRQLNRCNDPNCTQCRPESDDDNDT